jgi:hypothetical protein
MSDSNDEHSQLMKENMKFLFSENYHFSFKVSCQPIFLLKTDFQKISVMIPAKDKIFEINVCATPFFFSREQIVLLSTKAFFSIVESNQSFIINARNDISEKQLLSCFSELTTLFSKRELIEVSLGNVLIYQYLSEVLENINLWNICQNVQSSGQANSFFLTSEQFYQIPEQIFSSMNDFRILVNQDVIECNHIFASLISNKIFNQKQRHPENNFIDFSHHEFPQMIQKFFSVLKGKRIQINEPNWQPILNMINFLECDSVSVQKIIQRSPFNFVSNVISSLFRLKIDFIQAILGSNFLHLKDENQLFEFVKNCLQNNPENLNLIQYFHFGYVDCFDFINLISSIQFEEVTQDLLEHIKVSCSRAIFFLLKASVRWKIFNLFYYFQNLLKCFVKLKKKIKSSGSCLIYVQTCL